VDDFCDAWQQYLCSKVFASGGISSGNKIYVKNLFKKIVSLYYQV